jgi:hypothetical protein
LTADNSVFPYSNAPRFELFQGDYRSFEKIEYNNITPVLGEENFSLKIQFGIRQ